MSPLVPEIAYEHFLKVPVCITKDYTIKLEQHISGTFAHCDMLNWNKTVKCKFLAHWASVTANHGGPIYALHDLHDRKHQKFLEMCGFKRHKIMPALKEIWIWSNNG